MSAFICSYARLPIAGVLVAPCRGDELYTASENKHNRAMDSLFQFISLVKFSDFFTGFLVFKRLDVDIDKNINYYSELVVIMLNAVFHDIFII